MFETEFWTNPSFWIEAFGYLASFIVVFSLTRTSVKKLWIINGIGAIGFITYACIIESYPTALMNLGALVIDIVQLYRLHHIRISFELVPATPGSGYYMWFVDKHAEDIAVFDPEGRYKTAEKVFFYVRNNEVAGLLAYNTTETSSADIVLDYVTDKFRDCRIGRYFFGNDNPFFREVGISKFTTHTANPKHEGYLRQIGFSRETDGVWVKSF